MCNPRTLKGQGTWIVNTSPAWELSELTGPFQNINQKGWDVAQSKGPEFNFLCHKEELGGKGKGENTAICDNIDKPERCYST